MASVNVRPYLSPTLILLAMDWPDGRGRQDFLGFAIKRKPGFKGAAESWLPNRIGFNGPAPDHGDLPSNDAPIQKFMWWDARIDDGDRARTFTYTVTPVVGAPNALNLEDASAATVPVTIPASVQDGIGTWFNRAVVSSQAFVKEFGPAPEGPTLDAAFAWLANGLQRVVPDFLGQSAHLEGAVYHLTDKRWVIPAFQQFQRPAALVYDKKVGKDSGETTWGIIEDALSGQPNIDLFPRAQGAIMHDKFLVRVADTDGQPAALLTGSANFTTEGLTSQANLLHTFDSPELARLYLERTKLLEEDLRMAQMAKAAGWSPPVRVGGATIRLFFSPEPRGRRASIDTIIEAVGSAQSSVIFCLFDPTDAPLREAIFSAGDAGKMMFGLVNQISGAEPEMPQTPNAAAEARVEIYHRSRNQRDVFSHALFPRGGAPTGFWWEVASLPGSAGQWPVYIHHKFVVIDAETASPTIYTGSANMSNNSLHNNDENLLEIAGSPRLGQHYLAEFMRLYEHYRARAMWNISGKDPGAGGPPRATYRLTPDSRWAQKAYAPGTPEYKSRLAMVADI